MSEVCEHASLGVSLSLTAGRPTCYCTGRSRVPHQVESRDSCGSVTIGSSSNFVDDDEKTLKEEIVEQLELTG